MKKNKHCFKVLWRHHFCQVYILQYPIQVFKTYAIEIKAFNPQITITLLNTNVYFILHVHTFYNCTKHLYLIFYFFICEYYKCIQMIMYNKNYFTIIISKITTVTSHENLAMNKYMSVYPLISRNIKIMIDFMINMYSVSNSLSNVLYMCNYTHRSWFQPFNPHIHVCPLKYNCCLPDRLENWKFQ